jgi:hypothetical protein
MNRSLLVDKKLLKDIPRSNDDISKLQAYQNGFFSSGIRFQFRIYEKCARRKLRTERCTRESYARRILRTIYILTYIYKETKTKIKHRPVHSFYFILFNLVSKPHRNIIDQITAFEYFDLKYEHSVVILYVFLWTLSSTFVFMSYS